MEEAQRRVSRNGKEQFDRMIRRVNDATGLAIDIPELDLEEPSVQKKQKPEQAAAADEPKVGRQFGLPQEDLNIGRAQENAEEKQAEPPAAQAQPRKKPEPTRSAARWIEGWMQQANTEKHQPGYPREYFARIMAARMLADSKRGKVKRLKNTMLREKDIGEMADKLKENELFGRFIASLNSNGQKLAKAEAAVGTGHCGGLDDMFKDFLLKLPAGQLKNEKLLERYMPTARERIEELQRQAAQKEKSPAKECQKEAAEITILRNMVPAERNKKSSLERKIPTKDVSTLDEGTNALAQSALFRNALGKDGDRELRRLVQDGHGGALLDELRLRDKNAPQSGPEVTEILNENTVGGRLKTIRRDAEDLRKRIEDADYKLEDTDLMVEESKQLLAEYMALDMLSRDPVTRRIDPQRLERNVPWSKVESARKNPDKVPELRAITADLDEDKAMEGLRVMSESSQKDFFSAIQERYLQTLSASQRQTGGRQTLAAEERQRQSVEEEPQAENAEEFLYENGPAPHRRHSVVGDKKWAENRVVKVDEDLENLPDIQLPQP